MQFIKSECIDADGRNSSRQISGRSYEDVSRNRKWEFRRIMMNKKWWHSTKVAYQIYPKVLRIQMVMESATFLELSAS